MRTLFRIPALAVLTLGATALTAQAQEKATELTVGMFTLDYTTCSGCDGVFTLLTGGPYVAAGFYVNPGMSIEPTIAVVTQSQSGNSATTLSLGVAVPFYFKKGWGRQGPYIAPKIAYNSFSGTGSTSASQFNAGIGIGTKVPLNDNAALRLQGDFNYGFEGDFLATTSFGASLGLSVFLK
jgi:hypothetical protein